ncbi:hypothetical protein HPB48_011384 [Haemaphysalis longicornis]|uniref:Endonuclease/exonuclease/phosphatase domain-containing protein n=1 Tax=Haemaphysalis longicornis TaxID=44386 RepID=A0A9J6GH06_HAELO|nr:hypothetical protein HPB48_011384 [Haemaphysalis longicornis]
MTAALLLAAEGGVHRPGLPRTGAHRPERPKKGPKNGGQPLDPTDAAGAGFGAPCDVSAPCSGSLGLACINQVDVRVVYEQPGVQLRESEPSVCGLPLLLSAAFRAHRNAPVPRTVLGSGGSSQSTTSFLPLAEKVPTRRASSAIRLGRKSGASWNRQLSVAERPWKERVDVPKHPPRYIKGIHHAQTAQIPKCHEDSDSAGQQDSIISVERAPLRVQECVPVVGGQSTVSTTRIRTNTTCQICFLNLRGTPKIQKYPQSNSSTALQITLWNCRGFKSRTKRADLRLFLTTFENLPAVVALQETGSGATRTNNTTFQQHPLSCICVHKITRPT